MAALPRLDMLDWDLDAILNTQGSSSNKYSQFTPLGSQQSGSSGRLPSNISINLPDSSHGSIRLPDFGISPSPHKLGNVAGTEASNLNPFGDDDHLGVALEIDADGNLIGILGEEPELPPLPGVSDAQASLGQGFQPGSHAPDNLAIDANPCIVGEEITLPDAEAFPVTKTANQRAVLPTSETTTSESEQAAAPSRRGRRRKANIMLDERDCLSRDELRDFMNNYLKNMDVQRKRQKTTSLTQAKQNAAALVYGNGICRVGIPLSVNAQLVHPLAANFAGDFLRASLFGVDRDSQRSKAKTRRRGRSAAFANEQDEDGEARSAKHPRHDSPEIERFLHESEGNPLIPDDIGPELGMEMPGAMGDRHSSTMMPWSRTGSVVPGSSIRGSAQKPSPLPGRLGSVVQSIERHSDMGDQGMSVPDGHFPSSNS